MAEPTDHYIGKELGNSVVGAPVYGMENQKNTQRVDSFMNITYIQRFELLLRFLALFLVATFGLLVQSYRNTSIRTVLRSG